MTDPAIDEFTTAATAFLDVHNPARGTVTALAADRGQHVTGQEHAIGVARLEADPDVLAARRQPVLGDCLGQQRRLAQAGAAHHRGHPVFPAPEQDTQQPRASERARHWLGWLEPERARHVPDTLSRPRPRGSPSTPSRFAAANSLQSLCVSPA